MKEKVFIAKPVVENPLMDNISKGAMIAWFRCNSCYTCKFREEVIDNHPDVGIKWCGKTHEKYNIVDMVGFLGYERE